MLENAPTAAARVVPRIDCRTEAERISGFIRDQVGREFRRKGLVVGLSGGVDSALLAALAVRALGPEHVFALLLPERESSPDSERLGAAQAEALGISCERREITPVLEMLDVYRRKEEVIGRLFPGFDPTHDLTKMGLVGNPLERSTLNVFHLSVVKPSGEVLRRRLDPESYRRIVAAQNTKQRVRMLHLYRKAEELHYVVGGTTNLPELQQGLFVKHGDGAVDIEPLAHLYKSHVLRLAEHVGVLEEIRLRTPSPDTWSAGVGDEEFYFRLPLELVDALLYLARGGHSRERIAEMLELQREQVDRVLADLEAKQRATWHLRVSAPVLDERDGGGV